MPISDMLNRRVRARPEDDEEFSEVSGSEDISQDGSDADSNDSNQSQSDNSDAESAGAGSESEGSNSDIEEEPEPESDNGDDFKASLADISFGALAKAQASMRDKKRKDKRTAKEETSTASSTVDDIRAKLREAREQKLAAAEKSKRKEDKNRTSKHAPMVQSSKRAVSRKRSAVELPPAPKSRDPRFDAAVMGHSGVGKHPHGGSAYAFLDEYRASELKDLKDQMAKTKNPQQKEKLKAEIRRTEDKLRSAQNKKREIDVQAEHKKREKQLIREGKKATPYYLKNSELKKQVLERKFSEMGSRQRGKALERRRKKMASKERKEMPWERRGVEGDDGGMPNGGKRRRLE